MKVTVNILNGQMETFETMPVDVEHQSLDDIVKENVKKITAEKVPGNLEPIQWQKHTNRWPHLKGTHFCDAL